MIVFLPIKPKFAFSILNGLKKIEFRKLEFKRDVSKVIIYASSPHKKIIGFFSIKAIHKKSPRKIWKQFGTLGNISKAEYNEYYDGKDVAVGIEVDKITRFDTPIDPQDIISDFNIPQSFSYFPENKFRQLVKQGVN